MIELSDNMKEIGSSKHVTQVNTNRCRRNVPQGSPANPRSLFVKTEGSSPTFGMFLVPF
jgi:hypothetical protein